MPLSRTSSICVTKCFRVLAQGSGVVKDIGWSRIGTTQDAYARGGRRAGTLGHAACLLIQALGFRLWDCPPRLACSRVLVHARGSGVMTRGSTSAQSGSSISHGDSACHPKTKCLKPRASCSLPLSPFLFSLLSLFLFSFLSLFSFSYPFLLPQLVPQPPTLQPST